MTKIFQVFSIFLMFHFMQKSPRKKSAGPFDGFDNSDESETSSLCSEKSFDYGRGRPSDVSISFIFYIYWRIINPAKLAY